jgi:hypothetical protein
MTTMKCMSMGCQQEEGVRQIAFGLTTLQLCSEHLYEVSASRKRDARRIAKTLQELNPDLIHSDGWTYVVRLSSGLVKIGYTGRDKLERFSELSTRANEGQPVQVLAIMRGGETKEMAFHEQWMHLRVPGRSEQFYPDYSLLRWAEEQGIDPEADQETFAGWTERKHSSGKQLSSKAREMFGDAIEKAEEIQQAEQDSFWN